MIEMPKLNENDAYAYYDLVLDRMFGWTIATGGSDMRRKDARRAFEFFRRAISRGPRVDQFIRTAMAGEPVHKLWPEDMREEIERQINTRVPRAVNEPTSVEFQKSMREGTDPDWELPTVLKDHGRTA